jgi:nucleotide-binding universal stress UspA family protein
METIKKIMVPVAFSSHTHDLITYAVNLARPFGAELILANIINERDIETLERISSYGYNVDEAQYIKEIETERLEELKKVMEDIDYPDERTKVVFKVGHPPDAIMKLAVKEDVDMIVMGIRDKTDFLHTLTGSVADKVFRRSPVTIVSYRDEKNAAHLQKRLHE